MVYFFSTCCQKSIVYSVKKTYSHHINQFRKRRQIFETAVTSFSNKNTLINLRTRIVKVENDPEKAIAAIYHCLIPIIQ